MTEPGSDAYKVEASADKRLFVSMLVKDIELLPAVIDLVDNSVDGARATSPNDIARHNISLDVSPDFFAISDDCGGISLDIARHYAFRFGRPKDYDGVAGSVGQFGVGMKRALFKLGRSFEVISWTASSYFRLPVDVDAWVNDPDPEWQFRMSDIGDSPAEGNIGTRIKVENLHDSVKEDFANQNVLGQLREQLRLRHQSVLQQGLSIKLNGQRLTGLAPELLSGPDFSPVNRTLVVRTGDEGEVHVRIIAGVVASGSDENVDEGDAEAFRGTVDAGWWVFCNDRLLLYADRTATTGWGVSSPAYHPQYRNFRGYVYLESLRTELLPWNTTKTGVDSDSRVWRQVQSEMKVALSQVLSVINRVKSERERAEEDEDMPIVKAMARAKSVAVKSVPVSSIVVAPPPRQISKPAARRTSVQKIQYDVERDRYREAVEILGAPSAAEVGRQTFDYFYEREVD
jgi:hypothetical protein